MSKEEEDDTAKKLHLGGLSPTLTESDLREYFENYGRVVSIQIMPPPTPRAPSTYGFITFFDEEAVRRVMADGQNGKIIIGGREVSVNPAKRRQRHQPREKMEDYSNWYSSNDNSTYAGYGTNNSSYSNNNNNSIYNNSSSNNNRSKGHDGDDDDDDDSSDEVITKLFVGGIPEQVNSAALKKYFEQFGEVPYVEMIIDPKTLKRRGYGFVTFADPNVAKEVLKMRTTEIDGSTVNIGKADIQDKRDHRSKKDKGDSSSSSKRKDDSRGRYSRPSSSKRERVDPYRKCDQRTSRSDRGEESEREMRSQRDEREYNAFQCTNIHYQSQQLQPQLQSSYYMQLPQTQPYYIPQPQLPQQQPAQGYYQQQQQQQQQVQQLPYPPNNYNYNQLYRF